MPRFAANLSMMFADLPFAERFSAAAEAGFSAVECIFLYDHSPEEIAEHLTSNALEMVLMNSPHGDWDKGERGLAALVGREAEFCLAIDRVLPLAEATGCRRFHVMPGICDPDAAALECYVSNIRWAAQRLAAHDLDILLEPINRRDMPGFMLHSFDLAAELIDRISMPNVKLQFDIYHRQILHGDITRGLETLFPMIGHVQIADVPERNEPGTGEINFKRVFETLDELGYGGWVGCEFRPKDTVEDSLEWMSA